MFEVECANGTLGPVGRAAHSAFVVTARSTTTTTITTKRRAARRKWTCIKLPLLPTMSTHASASPSPAPSGDGDDGSPVATSHTGTGPQVVIEKRGRGRPRKYPVGQVPTYVRPVFLMPDGTPRKRGRPRKTPLPPGVSPPPPRPAPERRRSPSPSFQSVTRFDEDADLDVKKKGGYSLRRVTSQRNLDLSETSLSKQSIVRPRHAKRVRYVSDSESEEYPEFFANQYDELDLLASYLGDRTTKPKETKEQQKKKKRIKTESEPNAEAGGEGGVEKEAEEAEEEEAEEEEEQREQREEREEQESRATLPEAGPRTLPSHPEPEHRPAPAPATPTKRKRGRPSKAQVEAAATPSQAGTPSAERTRANVGVVGSRMIKPTSSDAYFFNNASRRSGTGASISTSTNTISSRLPTLNPSTLEAVVSAHTGKGSVADRSVRLYRRAMLPTYEAQLMAGYSLIFHGVGSKLPVLLTLLQNKAEAGEAAGVIVQGSMRGLRIEDVLAQIEALAFGSAGAGSAKGGALGRAQRLAAHFSGPPPSADDEESGPPALMVLLLAYDSPALQAARVTPVIETLCSAARIHVMACVDHVNAASLPGRWLWHSMSTYIPPLNDLLLSRGPSLPPSLNLSGKAAAPASSSSTPVSISETAALHILKSVTVKARALFSLLAREQTVPYIDLLDVARRNFLASTENDLRQLLVEFRDHGLIRRRIDDDEGDIVYIPMAADDIARTLESIKDI